MIYAKCKQYSGSQASDMLQPAYLQNKTYVKKFHSRNFFNKLIGLSYTLFVLLFGRENL